MPLFDPATGKILDKEALRSLHFNGKGMKIPRTVVRDNKKITESLDEKGRTDGYSTEHKSGRVDQDVFVKSIEARTQS
jgi:hypothetical protein